MRTHFMVNEVFYSLQGEGIRAGTANTFVRFSGCNLTCSRDNEAGFDCDTEFVSGRKMVFDDIQREINEAAQREGCTPARGVILTGGEPALQIDEPFIRDLKDAGFYVAIETNGTIELPPGIDWVCVSPKSAEHTIRVKECHEVKYVRHWGQGLPRPSVKAEHYLLSPAFRQMVDGTFEVEHRALEWCIKLVKENPLWRLSTQQHKLWRVR